MRVIMDGRPVDPAEAGVSVFDWGLLRGDGIFEAVRSYGGRLFQLDAHLARLQRSAALMRLDLPEVARLAEWATEVGRDGGDCTVRILVTRGGTEPDMECPGRVVVLWESLHDVPSTISIRPTPAPWQSGGIPWELMGAKTLSYAPNMSAWRSARAEGFTDALLVSRDGLVLEGPTFSIGWVTGGTVETPSLDLGILASITRTVALEEAARLGIPVVEGQFEVDRLNAADEVFAMSTLKEVTPVHRVGEHRFEPGPVTAELAGAYRARVKAETA